MEDEFLRYLYQHNVILWTQYVRIFEYYVIWKLNKVLENRKNEKNN